MLLWFIGITVADNLAGCERQTATSTIPNFEIWKRWSRLILSSMLTLVNRFQLKGGRYIRWKSNLGMSNATLTCSSVAGDDLTMLTSRHISSFHKNHAMMLWHFLLTNYNEDVSNLSWIGWYFVGRRSYLICTVIDPLILLECKYCRAAVWTPLNG